MYISRLLGHVRRYKYILIRMLETKEKNGIPLENVTEEKDLGITVTESFKPGKQCSIAAAKSNRILGIIKKNFYQ